MIDNQSVKEPAQNHSIFASSSHNIPLNGVDRPKSHHSFPVISQILVSKVTVIR